jgi:hypothetical protein
MHLACGSNTVYMAKSKFTAGLPQTRSAYSGSRQIGKGDTWAPTTTSCAPQSLQYYNNRALSSCVSLVETHVPVWTTLPHAESKTIRGLAMTAAPQQPHTVVRATVLPSRRRSSARGVGALTFGFWQFPELLGSEQSSQIFEETHCAKFQIP